MKVLTVNVGLTAGRQYATCNLGDCIAAANARNVNEAAGAEVIGTEA